MWSIFFSGLAAGTCISGALTLALRGDWLFAAVVIFVGALNFYAAAERVEREKARRL